MDWAGSRNWTHVIKHWKRIVFESNWSRSLSDCPAMLLWRISPVVRHRGPSVSPLCLVIVVCRPTQPLATKLFRSLLPDWNTLSQDVTSRRHRLFSGNSWRLISSVIPSSQFCRAIAVNFGHIIVHFYLLNCMCTAFMRVASEAMRESDG